ncbi:sigma-70 family RNA polymerase sigma factor [Streptomyces ardesiacus]|uniref:Sigma-70 family RNA polymerase sigma factor n=1 Tax=Streptomyces ardesiacus TaxID=285564 RepID=A0ABW8HJE3_9ACTN
MTTPPSPFEGLQHLSAPGDPAERAKAAGAALQAVPKLQQWLRDIRQQAVGEMRDEGMSHAEVGAVLGVSRARAQQIAEGRTTGKRAGE